jgi:hypothetical protein
LRSVFLILVDFPRLSGTEFGDQSAGVLSTSALVASCEGSTILKTRRLNTAATVTNPEAVNMGMAFTVWGDRNAKFISRSIPARMGPKMRVTVA